MMNDPIVDMVDRASEELIKRCGGVKGWIEYLREMDRVRARQAKQRTAKKFASNGRKSQTRAVKPKATLASRAR